jgi:hypothetical protein
MGPTSVNPSPMFADRFRGYFHHHPHGAPLGGALLLIVVVLVVVALIRTAKD